MAVPLKHRITHVLRLILGGTGWFLLAVISIVIVVAPLYLPVILYFTGLSPPERWPPIILTVVWLTVGAWVGTLLTSIARVLVWLRFKLAMTAGDEWTREKEDVLAVQSLSLWLLGLLTVLSAYLTQWFVGSI